MNYFFGFFAAFFGSGFAAFLGRPLLGTTRIASTAEALYTFVLPTFRVGIIPAARNWTFTVSNGLFSFSAISLTVNSVIIPISVYFIEIFNKFKWQMGALLNNRYPNQEKNLKKYTEIGLFYLKLNRYRYIFLYR